MNDKISTNAVWSKIDGDEEFMVNSISNSTINSSNKACYKCGSIIPIESDFCPYCGIKLLLDCPKCNNRYSSQFKFCSKCGVNKDEYLLQQKRVEEQRKIECIGKEQERPKLIEIERQQEELHRTEYDKENSMSIGGWILLAIVWGAVIYGIWGVYL